MDFPRTLNFSFIVLMMIVLVYGEDGGFAFPDEVKENLMGTKPRLSGNRYEQGGSFRPSNYEHRDRPNFGNFGNAYNRHPQKFVGNNGFNGGSDHGLHPLGDSGFASHPVYNRPPRPWQGSGHGGINKDFQPGGSSSNTQSNAQSSNGYANSNSQANSQSHQGWGDPGFNGGASSASSAASASTGIVNGVPVASAAAAAAAASGNNGGLSSSLASAIASGGKPSEHNQNISPWYFRNRLADNDETITVEARSSQDDNDQIVFRN